MDQRGRKSEAEQLAPDILGNWPEPPAVLSEREAALWRDVVLTKPADWFPKDTQPLLADYCTYCVQQDDLRAELHECKNSADRVELLRAMDLVAKQKVSLATRMRLTPQSRYTPQASATKARTMAQTRPPHLA